MIRPKHIRTQLALWYSFGVGCVLVVCGVAVAFLFLRGLREEFDRNLGEHFERAARHLERGPDGEVRLRKPEKVARSPGRDFAEEIPVEVWSAGGTLLFRSPAWKRAILEVGAPRGVRQPPSVRSLRAAQGGSYRLMEGMAEVDSLFVTLRAALTEERIWTELKGLLAAFLLLVPMALVLAGISGYAMASKALRPVDEMNRRTQAITADRLADRIPVENPGDELGTLSQTINGLLDRLQKAFEELRRFTSDASHELRTPLQALRSVGEVALQRPHDAGYYRTVISSMLEETDRMARLADNLLMLSRGDAGQLRLNRVPTCVRTLVEETAHLLEVLADEKGQKIVVESQTRPILPLDGVVFRQAVVNLVDNAIKYAPPRTQITARIRTGEASAVIVEISDSGPGIKEEHRSLIFDRFYRVDQSRSRDRGGAGLGLAIARWAVQAHGGLLDLDPSRGPGSTFRIVLPGASG